MTDTSGGVLPGVTVVAKVAEERIVAQTLTNEVGRFAFEALPPGRITLTFELSGFESSVLSVSVEPGIDSSIVERLRLAPMTEAVLVVGKEPPPPLPRTPDPPPLPAVVPLDARELESVCKPAKPGASAGPLGTIRSHRLAVGRMLFAKGDELVISGGSNQGLEVGRNLIVQRYFRSNTRAAEFPQLGEHVAGLLQIVKASEDSSIGVVVHTCNEMRPGDLVAAFTPEYVQTPEPVGTPDYDSAAQILFADAGQMMGAPRRLLVVDRGSAQGLQAGQRLTLFRRKIEANPIVLGEAIVVSARINSATIRVVAANDAIEFGDWAAPQR